MKANCYPESFEVTDRVGVESQDYMKELALAIKTSEIILGLDIKLKSHVKNILLRPGENEVLNPGLRNVKVSTLDTHLYFYDSDKGTVFLEVMEGEFDLSYTTGFDNNKVPAIIRELILSICVFIRISSDSNKDDILFLAENIKSNDRKLQWV